MNVDAASPSAERVCGAQPDTTDLTLSTASVAPDAVTLAPGISVNLVECEKNGTCTLIPNTDPAGGIKAGANDMARWMIAQLDCGRVGNTRLWKQGTTRQQWSVVTPLAAGPAPKELAPFTANFQGYGLGFSSGTTAARSW